MKKENKTLIWAHRGASAYAPENTLAAFRLAEEMGADGVELDVQRTKDGELVVIHDEKIDRVSEGHGYVKDMTLSELRRFHYNRAHAEFAETYPQAEIPTLREVYTLLKPGKLSINVELKTGIFPYEGIEEEVLDLTREMGMEDRVLYSSFGHRSLCRLKELDPEAKLGLLYSDAPIRVRHYARKEVGVDALHPAIYHLLEEDYTEKAHKKGLKVHVWTVNEKDEIALCLAQGVDAIITNKPDYVREFLGNLSAKKE